MAGSPPAGSPPACSLLVPWSASLAEYDFGPGHPLAPVRVLLTMELAAALGVLSAPAVNVSPSFAPASDSELAVCHSSAYIAAVRRGLPDYGFGLGTPDDPVFPGMHDASALVAGASLAAARAVWSGTALHAANVAGGLHHAQRGSASGFCVYNDPALAIAWLLSAGASRVAYVDTDVHHGDGVQAAFYDDPRVLTISLHEDPASLFPGTGLPSETGVGPGAGYAVNVALPPFTGDAGWLRAFDAVVPPLLRAFRPAVLVTQHGCDTHRLDPLAHLSVSVDGQRQVQSWLHDLAHEVADGRWLLLGGGGYSLVNVVPRSWTHLLAIAAGAPVAPEVLTPSSWRSSALAMTGETAPTSMTDGADASFTASGAFGASGASGAGSDPVDSAIAQTIAEVGRAEWAAGAF